MADSVEFKVSSSIFDDVKNDPNFRLVFKTESFSSPVLTLHDGLALMAQTCDDLQPISVDLSYLATEQQFDYAKLAIMGGDRGYLDELNQNKIRQSKPLLRAIYEELVARNSSNSDIALKALRLKEWDARRVMYSLSTLIPLKEDMGIDFRQIAGPNPTIRIVGKGFDEVAKTAIRYDTLIKIACDPAVCREAYMWKVHQLINERAPLQQENQMPRIRIFLQPIMSRASRAALDQIEMNPTSNPVYQFLTVLRSAIDMHLVENLRIRQGLNMLLKVIDLTTNDLLRALNNHALLLRHGIMRMNERSTQTLAMLTNTIKSLNHPVTRSSIMAARQRAFETYQATLRERDDQHRRIKRRLAEEQNRRAASKPVERPSMREPDEFAP